MPWILFFLAMFLARTSQLGLLYFCESPIGGEYIRNYVRLFLYAIPLEASHIAFATVIFALLCRKFTKRLKLIKILAVCLGTLYLSLSAVNDELLRWMSQNLTLSFLFTYSHFFSDMDLAGKIIDEGYPHFIAESVAVVLGCTLSILSLFLFKAKGPLKVRSLVILLAGILFLTATIAGVHVLVGPKAFRRIAPITVHFVKELSYDMTHSVQPDDYAMGIDFLGGDSTKKYPFFKEVPNEKENIQAFKSKPLEEKPDIILLTIESLRGWVANPQNPEICEFMPNYCGLVKSGAYFPHAYSVGFPSIEGFLGINGGIWAHPERTLLSEHQSTRFSTLPEILKRAGYHRVILSAVDPRFDNMQSWSLLWYDYERHSIRPQNDMNMANAFIEAYKNRPKDKPLFINWMNISTHSPFVIPKLYRKTHRDLPKGNYEKTLAYFDHALGIILKAIEEDPRKNNTIIILSGDHAFPTKNMSKLNQHGVHAGFVWVPISFIGPNITAGSVYENPVSQVDIAPTVLDLLGLKVSNSFVGRNILTQPTDKAIAFRLGDISVFTGTQNYYTQREGDEILVENKSQKNMSPNSVFKKVMQKKRKNENRQEQRRIKAAADAWQWILDNDLLIPEDYAP